jgi:epoxyqueuosine reductase
MNGALQLEGLNLEQQQALLAQLRGWASVLGFSQIGVADVDLSDAEPGLLQWLANGFHGSMAYMARHGVRRARPAELIPGTVRVITARMNYLPQAAPADWQAVEWQRLADPSLAALSMYARGRDYHKVLRARLQQLADRLAEALGPFGHRVFTDSAPVLEVELASKSGIGWRGKHTLVLNREAGSMFFLGEIYVDLPLPLTPAAEAHCGTCSACIDVCPTRAIVAPYRLDARRCISYLTIEHDGPIPIELRPLMGNRIYGCDDCQLVCPWNKYAQRSTLADFDPREGIADATLLELWAWTEADFLRNTEGSAIRRISYRRWQRNLAVALGNALRATLDSSSVHPSSIDSRIVDSKTLDRRHAIEAALRSRVDQVDELVREHIEWASAQGAASASRGGPGEFSAGRPAPPATPER